jgi:hypothetical protein
MYSKEEINVRGRYGRAVERQECAFQRGHVTSLIASRDVMQAGDGCRGYGGMGGRTCVGEVLGDRMGYALGLVRGVVVERGSGCACVMAVGDRVWGAAGPMCMHVGCVYASLVVVVPGFLGFVYPVVDLLAVVFGSACSCRSCSASSLLHLSLNLVFELSMLVSFFGSLGPVTGASVVVESG